MKECFIKRLQGHELEFTRLDSVKYNISIKSPGFLGINVIADKDERGNWVVNHSSTYPYWLNEITTDIYETIASNEEFKINEIYYNYKYSLY